MELTNNKLRVFSLSKSQLEEYLNNPSVFFEKHNINGQTPSEEDARSMRSLLDKCDQEDMQWYSVFLITDKVSRTLYGHICYCGINKSMVEIGYSLHEQYRNQGIMTEAVRLVSSEALRHPNVTRVCAQCLPNNPASARVLEKNHFRLKKQGDVLLYVKRSEQRTYPLLICALLGVILGVSIGHFFFGSMHNGLNIGIYSGLALGAIVSIIKRNKNK